MGCQMHIPPHPPRILARNSWGDQKVNTLSHQQQNPTLWRQFTILRLRGTFSSVAIVFVLQNTKLGICRSLCLVWCLQYPSAIFQNIVHTLYFIFNFKPLKVLNKLNKTLVKFLKRDDKAFKLWGMLKLTKLVLTWIVSLNIFWVLPISTGS